MTLIAAPTYPADGDDALVSPYNLILQTLIAIVNGNLDDSNISSISGTKIAAGTLPASALSPTIGGGWTPLGGSVAYSSNNGNKEYVIQASNVDLSGVVSAGMRLKVDRSSTPSTQCANFTGTSSHYASRANGSVSGITFTGTYTLEAMIYLTSYSSNHSEIVNRSDTSGGNNGFGLRVNVNGQLECWYGSASYVTGSSIELVQLNRWVHVAAAVTASTKSITLYINGAAVAMNAVTGSATSINNTGQLNVGTGTFSGTPIGYFTGSISDVRIWSTVRTASQIADNMNIRLLGSETGLVACYKLEGNFNDLTSNGNTLTANNGVTATYADNPQKSTEMALVTKVTYSSPNTLITVFTGTDYNIPNAAIYNPYYSAQHTPFGFPAQRKKWSILVGGLSATQLSPTAGSWYNLGGHRVRIPTGAWNVRYSTSLGVDRSAAGRVDNYMAVSTSSTAPTSDELTNTGSTIDGYNVQYLNYTASRIFPLELLATTVYYLLFSTAQSSIVTLYAGNTSKLQIIAESAYL